MDEYNLGFEDLIGGLNEVSELSLMVEEIIETAQDLTVAMCGVPHPDEDDRELTTAKMFGSGLSRLLSRTEGFSYAVEVLLADTISRSMKMFLLGGFESMDDFSESIVSSLSTLDHAPEWANQFASGGMKLIYLHAHDQVEEWSETTLVREDIETMPLSYLRALILAEAFATVCGIIGGVNQGMNMTADVIGTSILAKTNRDMVFALIEDLGDENEE